MSSSSSPATVPRRRSRRPPRRGARARARARAGRAGRRPRADGRRARRSVAPSRMVMTGSSIARQAAWAGGIRTPARASASAGSQRRGHGKRPNRRQSSSEPGGNARNGAAGDADGVGNGLRRRTGCRARRAARGPACAEAGHGDEEVEQRPHAPSRRPSRCAWPPPRGPSSRSRRRTRRARRRPRRRRPMPPSRRIVEAGLGRRRMARGDPGRLAPRLHGVRTLVDAHRLPRQLLAFCR